MEKDPKVAREVPDSEPQEKPSPFDPDPDLVTFLERGTGANPKQVWEATQPERD